MAADPDESEQELAFEADLERALLRSAEEVAAAEAAHFVEVVRERRDDGDEPGVVVFDPSAAAGFGDEDGVYLHSISVLSSTLRGPYILVAMVMGGIARTEPDKTDGEAEPPSSNLSPRVLRKLYSRMPRFARKNIQALVLHQPSRMARAMLVFARNLVARKFFRKVHTASSLAALASHVPLPLLGLSPAAVSLALSQTTDATLSTIALVGRKKKSFFGGNSGGDNVSLDSALEKLSAVFGRPLEDMESDPNVWAPGAPVPILVQDMLDALHHPHVIASEGLFRIPASALTIKQIRLSYEVDRPFPIHLIPDPNLPAALLKLFFRELPLPLIPDNVRDILTGIVASRAGAEEDEAEEDPALLESIEAALSLLPPPHASVLSSLLPLLVAVVDEESNRMTINNVSTVWAPNLFSPPTLESMLSMSTSDIPIVSLLIRTFRGPPEAGLLPSDPSLPNADDAPPDTDHAPSDSLASSSDRTHPSPIPDP